MDNLKIIEIMKEYAQKNGITEFCYTNTDFNIHSLTSGVKVTKHVEHEITEQNFIQILKSSFGKDNELKIKVLPYLSVIFKEEILNILKELQITIENQKEVIENSKKLVQKHQKFFKEKNHLNVWFYQQLLKISPIFSELKNECAIVEEPEKEFIEIIDINIKRYHIGISNFMNLDDRNPHAIVNQLVDFFSRINKKQSFLDLLEVEELTFKRSNNYEKESFYITAIEYKNEFLLDRFIDFLPQLNVRHLKTKDNFFQSTTNMEIEKLLDIIERDVEVMKKYWILQEGIETKIDSNRKNKKI